MKAYRFLLGLLLLAGCQPQQTFDKEATRNEMRKLMLSYIAAAERLDADAVINHFYDNPEFHIYSDGIDLTLDQLKENVRKNWFTDVKKLEVKYDTMRVHVFSLEEAHCFLKLTELFTYTSGKQHITDVELTFSGVKTSKGWKLDYAHAYHKERED